MLLLNTGAIIILFRQGSTPLQVIVRYVTLQEIGTCLFVLGWVRHLPELMTLGLLLKLGLPPFHVWLLECRFGVNYERLWSLLTISKLLPLSLIFSIRQWIWGILYVIIGRLGIFRVHSVVNLLVISRWLIIGWMTICIGTFSVILGLLVYTAIISRAITLIAQSDSLVPNSINWIRVFMFLGLPLRRIFLIKFYLISEISLFFNGLILVVMMIARVLSIVGYYHVHVLHAQSAKSFRFSHNWQSRTGALSSWLLGMILLCIIV